ncbi:hypothetical protein M5K25_006228 [Dendrobium thyrsiflorum]|uniref:Retrotransposon Copia-like N-terminal domain-containing protein n=1 Tax=Dendrobium thyrsiflorum TaxID=117978 RepID=A0ABD0VHZ7_DENTH
MADQDSSSPTQPASSLSATMTDFTIPSPLKFLMTNLKLIVPNQLTNDNYPIWRLQFFKLFSANGFDGYLTGHIPKPSQSLAETNPADSHRPEFVLPYILNLSSAHEIWLTLERRLQPTNRSRVIRLKNELHHIQMKDLTMMQYLDKIKAFVDNIAVAGTRLDSKYIILHILTAYLHPKIPSKLLYAPVNNPSALIEEIHMQAEVQRDTSQLTDHTVLYSTRSITPYGRSNYKGSRVIELRSIFSFLDYSFSMALKAAIFVLLSLLLVISTREVATPVGGGSVAPSPAPVPAPAPAPHIFVNFEECPLACKARCKLHSRQGLCNRACMTCCKGCKCVPPGTAGNRELCGPCYTQWTTHGNRTKCP